MDSQIHNINVVSKTDMPTPGEVKAALPLDLETEKSIVASRQVIQAIHDGRDPRLFAVVGPCSIHDVDAAHEYATRLKALADEVSDTIVILMRVYFEKPRTTVGWKGLINDPFMDDSFHVETPLHYCIKVSYPAAFYLLKGGFGNLARHGEISVAHIQLYYSSVGYIRSGL